MTVSPMDDALRDRLIGLVSRLLGPDVELPEPFPLERQLSDLGVTSLKMVNLMLAIELEFDIAIPLAEITPETFYSIRSMGTLVQQLVAPAVTRAD